MVELPWDRCHVYRRWLPAAWIDDSAVERGTCSVFAFSTGRLSAAAEPGIPRLDLPSVSVPDGSVILSMILIVIFRSWCMLEN